MPLAVPLFFVSGNQVNYQMPPGIAPGEATVTITSGARVLFTGAVHIADVAPGLFTADASGRGLPAATAQRIRDNTTIASDQCAVAALAGRGGEVDVVVTVDGKALNIVQVSIK